VTIEPGTTVEIPINGVCVNVNRPPVPLGNTMPPPNEWFVPGGDVNPDMPPDFSFNPDAVSTVPRPGGGTAVTNIPIDLTNDPMQTVVVDADKYPATAAQFLFDAVSRIQTTTEQMQSLGAIRTPFANNADREKEAIVQQTVWIYSSALSGDDYSKDQFAEKLQTQFENNSGGPLTGATDEQKEQFNSGIDQFWNTFELVGMEAKVFSNQSTSKQDGDPRTQLMTGDKGNQEIEDQDNNDAVSAPQEPSADDEDDENNACECGEAFLNIRVKSEDGSYDRNKDIISGGTFDAKAAKGVTGDKFELTFSDIVIECTCDEEQCETYKTRKPGSEKKRPGAKSGSLRIAEKDLFGCTVTQNNNDNTEFTVELDDFIQTRSMTILIEAICQSGDCDSELCQAYVEIDFGTKK